jgi:hypothetical protein
VDEYDNDYDPHPIHGGDAFRQDAYCINTVTQDDGTHGWTDSEAYMAACMRQAIRKEELL